MITLHLGFTLLPCLLGGLYWLTHPGWLEAGYINRDFTLTERLLTQARVLWFYLGLIFLPSLGRMGLYHDDFSLSTSLWQPLSTFPAVAALLAMLSAALLLARRYPAFLFSVGFFLIGHSIESSVIPLEMVHEHRNYLPLFGPLFGSVLAIYTLWQHHPGLRRLLAGAGVIVLLGLALLTTRRAADWGNDLQRALLDARHHPDSPRSQVEAGILLTQAAQNQSASRQLLEQASYHFSRAAELDRYAVNGQFGLLVVEQQLGRSLDPARINTLERQLKTPPLAASTPDALIRFIECHSDERCQFSLDTVMRLTRALSENPNLRPADRARVYAAAVQLFLNRQQPQSALIFAVASVQAQPEHVQLRLNLAATLMDLGRLSDARLELEQARKLDLDDFYLSRHDRLQSQLDALQKQIPDTPDIRVKNQ